MRAALSDSRRAGIRGGQRVLARNSWRSQALAIANQRSLALAIARRY
jgi:hypothetical protein